jgi:hypothetical protein
MIISGVLFETVRGRAGTVAMRLARIDGLELVGTDGDNHLSAVWRGPDGWKLEREAEQLINSDNDILGIYPTFVGND